MIQLAKRFGRGAKRLMYRAFPQLRFANSSWSQEGEDVLLQRIFADQQSGMYVDVGAHHPFRFSNTHWAYRRGWRGINVDPDPGAVRLLNMRRPGDTNVQCLVGAAESTVDFFTFTEGALNTSDPERRDLVTTQTGMVPSLVKMEMKCLKSVLDEHLPGKDLIIDFISIDVEGREMDVIAGNDWTRYRPRIVVVELAGTTLETVNHHPVSQILMKEGYTPVSLLYHSAFFIGDEELLRSWKAHS